MRSVAVAGVSVGVEIGAIASNVCVPGAVIEGAPASCTTTLKEDVAVFPAVSVEEQFTVVVPYEKTEPEESIQVTTVAPSITSVAVGFVYVTAVVVAVVVAITSACAAMTGASSVTMIRNDVVAIFAPLSVAEHETLVVPIEKSDVVVGAQVEMIVPSMTSVAEGEV